MRAVATSLLLFFTPLLAASVGCSGSSPSGLFAGALCDGAPCAADPRTGVSGNEPGGPAYPDAGGVTDGSRVGIPDAEVRIEAGAPCQRDSECPGAICNWKLRRCAQPAPTGAPCQRDSECAGDLCNWKLNQCSSPGALGAVCQRDSECAGDLCNWKTNQCAVPGGAGATCRRDSECASGTCNTATSTCM